MSESEKKKQIEVSSDKRGRVIEGKLWCIQEQLSRKKFFKIFIKSCFKKDKAFSLIK